ncbi:MAG: response regulator [Synergistaceae bacterium]|nr:response regulator [Synergistaceae bacterium]
MKQIMVVDDNLMNLRQISALLEGEYSVMLAKSGAQALSICRREIPDLILMDIEMPAMDGFAAIEQLRQSDALSQVPVIFLTANHDVAAEVRGLESGAIDFITKPVEKSILLHRIRIHLELQDYQTDLEETLDKLEKSIVVSFADLVECKNDNTGGHVLRTSKYVEMIGREV